MTAEGFKAWLGRMGGPKRPMSDRAAAEALGMSRNSIKAYKDGTAEVPKVVALACAALAYGLPPMK